MLFTVGAFATIVPYSGFQVYKDAVNEGNWYSTNQQACDAGVAFIKTLPPSLFGVVSITTAVRGSTCTPAAATYYTSGTYMSGSPSVLTNYSCAGSGCNFGSFTLNIRQVSNVCPDHSLLIGGVCKCDTGYEERDGLCKTPGSICVDKATLPAIAPGVTQEFSTTKPASSSGMFAPRNVCIEQCQANGTPAYWACGGTRCTVHFKSATYTGQPCAPDGGPTAPAPDPTPTPDAQRCPDGKVPGTVNGTNVCVTPGEAGSSSGTSGSTSNTGTNADGTPAPTSGTGTSSTSNTSCNGTTCTTTTTTTTSSTNSSGQTSTAQQTSSTQQPQLDYCGKNPKAKECAGNEETQSAFNGACATGFVAKSDDAVINAMAEETFRQNCKVNPDQASTVLANEERVKTGNQTGSNPNNVSLSISPSSIDTSDAIGGGGGCITDKVISVAGGSVALPFSRACDSFPMLGTLLVAISFLVAAVIIMRG
ncbi:virulence factor TspB C-terminal domain-related protein [Variovorax sp. W1I1]|uniref:virulence factor TspB C-terminal domain-related protein n=1 Tax=Variovorax sp. W1I1 TaxID=3042309 RepID=UPI0027D8C790|nr:virulence factor TspB C-terminal domain-related protein [Variovorax sp. W1I1]